MLSPLPCYCRRLAAGMPIASALLPHYRRCRSNRAATAVATPPPPLPCCRRQRWAAAAIATAAALTPLPPPPPPRFRLRCRLRCRCRLGLLPLPLRLRGRQRRRRQDNLDVIVCRCWDERCRRQPDAGSSSNSNGDSIGVVVVVGGGGGSSSRGRDHPCFGIGEVGRQPLHSVVGIVDRVRESHGAVRVFSRPNWPKDAVLTMDDHPLQLNLGAVGGLEVDHQLTDGIFPPRRASIKETQDGFLQKVLGIVELTLPKMFFAVWLLRALFATAWTIAPTSFLGSFYVGINCKTMTMDKEDKKRGEGGSRFDRRGRDHNSCDNYPWARHFLCSLQKDRKMPS